MIMFYGLMTVLFVALLPLFSPYSPPRYTVNCLTNLVTPPHPNIRDNIEAVVAADGIEALLHALKQVREAKRTVPCVVLYVVLYGVRAVHSVWVRCM